MSLADGLATALLRYERAKDEHGLEALLLGRVLDAAALESDGPVERRRSDSRRPYKVKRLQPRGRAPRGRRGLREGAHFVRLLEVLT